MLLLRQPLVGRALQPTGSSLDYDFGTVRQGNAISHTFAVPVDGGETTIQKVELNRPGMKAQFSPKSGADGMASVTFIWDTTLAIGRGEGQAKVRWSDPSRSPAILKLTGTIRPVFEVLPNAAVFFTLYHDENREQVVTIVNRDDVALGIKGIEPVGEHFKASLRTVAAGQEYQVVIQVRAGTQPGRYLETLLVDTTSDVRPRVPVAVNVFVKRDVFAFPDDVNFGRIDRAQLGGRESLAQLLAQTVLITRRQGPFEIRSVRTDVPALRIKQSPESGPSAIFRFDIEVDLAKLTPGILTGSIHFETSDAAFADLVVPVRGDVR